MTDTRHCKMCGAPLVRRRYGASWATPIAFCGEPCMWAFWDRPGSKPRPDGSRSASLDAYMIGNIGRLTPRTPSQLHQIMADNWGAISLRQIYRVLARLRRSGRIERSDGGYVLARRRRLA